MSFLLEGITAVTWQQAVMYVVGIILIWLAVKKEYEPSLLLPLGFGAILVNLPYSGVVDQMVQGKVPAAGISCHPVSFSRSQIRELYRRAL